MPMPEQFFPFPTMASAVAPPTILFIGQCFDDFKTAKYNVIRHSLGQNNAKVISAKSDKTRRTYVCHRQKEDDCSYRVYFMPTKDNRVMISTLSSQHSCHDEGPDPPRIGPKRKEFVDVEVSHFQ